MEKRLLSILLSVCMDLIIFVNSKGKPACSTSRKIKTILKHAIWIVNLNAGAFALAYVHISY